jgi:PAS domain S-box-containing protein
LGVSDSRNQTAVDQYDPDDPPIVPDGISRSSMQKLPFALVLSDASLEDNPIVYVNAAFEKMTSYTAEAVVGRNCRFLQGEDTEPETRERIREAIDEEREIAVDIVNYRADGSRFLNRLLISPLKDDDGTTTHFLGIQSVQPETSDFEGRARELDESLREVQHRVKNHLSMLLALIRMEARNATDAKASLGVLANRVESLNVLYDSFAQGPAGNKAKVGLGAYISRVCGALNMLDGQREVRVNIETERFEASVDNAAHVGLLVSELLTNSLQHAFDDTEQGVIAVRFWDHDDDSLGLEVSDNGSGLPEGCNWPQEGNLGARIVRDLAKRLDAELDVTSGENGTTVYLEIPKRSLRASE